MACDDKSKKTFYVRSLNLTVSSLATFPTEAKTKSQNQKANAKVNRYNRILPMVLHDSCSLTYATWVATNLTQNTGAWTVKNEGLR